MFDLQLSRWRLSVVILLMLLLLTQSASAGRRVDRSDISVVSSKSETIRKVFEYIEKESNYILLYDGTVNSMLSRDVEIALDGRQVEDILKELCSKASLSYSIDGRQITITPVLSQDENPQTPANVNVTGNVSDENGLPLIGASVMIKGTTSGVITDLDGFYSMMVPVGSELVFSYIGYKEIVVNSDRGGQINVTLEPDSRLLDEVVVVGYGSQKKVNLTGAVDVVDAEEIAGRSASNTSNLLVGVVPNMNITQGNGRPGQGGSINIRGVNSISSSTGPLVLIDGVEGSIDTVNPNDIASISVLKDASAAAVYGARAAYGVILVTTKSGADGKAHVSYTGRYSFSSPTVSTDFETRGYYSASIVDMFFSTYQGSPYTNYDAEDYYQLWIRRNDKTEHPDRPWVVVRDGEYKYYANFDWYNYFFDESRPTWEHDISVYGGNDKLNYRISGGYYDADGVLNAGGGDNFNRYNFRTKISAQITPWLKVSNNTSFNTNAYTYNSPSNVGAVFTNSQLHAIASVTPTNPDGTATWKVPGAIKNASYIPAGGYSSILEHGKTTNTDKDTMFGTTFDVEITPMDHLRIIANYTYQQNEGWNVNRSMQVPYSTVPGVVETRTDIIDRYYDSKERNWYNAANLYANYDNTFKGHHIGVTAGANYETRFYSDMTASRTGLISEDLNDFNLAKGDEMVISGGKNRYALLGFFYRLNYDYEGKYLFEASGRYDGSSRFAKGQRFGFFPSFSAGWRIDQEKWFAPAKKYVSSLKLRASYGVLGNQQVGYYDYIQTIESGSSINYSFGSSNLASGATISAPNASDFTWETVTNMNIGLDVSFLDGRLNFTGEAYIRDTKDMLMASQDLPSVYGASAPKSNAASLRSKGWEISIGWKDGFMLGSKMFNYNVNASLADYVSDVTYYNNENKTIGTPYTGQRLGEIWGYVVDGYFLSDEEAEFHPVDQSYVNEMINISAKDSGIHAGDLKFVDMDGDAKILPTLSADDVKDMVVIGNSLPRYTYSFSLGANWNGIDFSALFQGVGYQNWYPGVATYLFWGPYSRPFSSFIHSDFLSQVWSEDNPNAYFPRPRGYVAYSGNRELAVVNNKYLQNVGYLRLKNLTVGYTLPEKWMDRIKAEKIRFYFSGENLFTASPIETDYIDPSLAGGSTSWSNGRTNVNGYPLNRIFSFGVDVTF